MRSETMPQSSHNEPLHRHLAAAAALLLLLATTHVAGAETCATSPCDDIPKAVNGSCADLTTPGGGYTCSCAHGWVWDNSSLACSDYNACAGSPCSATPNAVNSSCLDVPAPSLSYSCSCSQGYSWDAGNSVCVDTPNNSSDALSSYVLVPGMYWIYNDLNNGCETRVPTIEDCAALCSATPGCKVFTSDDWDGGNCPGACGLKSSVSNTRALYSHVTFGLPKVNFTTESGVKFTGHDVPGQADACTAGLSSIDQCAALCGSTPGCSVVLFKDPAAGGNCPGGCWLKNGKGSGLQNDSSIAIGMLPGAQVFVASAPLAYIGCFVEPVCVAFAQQRVMDYLGKETAMTVERCIQLAAERGYTYAAVQYYSECFASNDISLYTKPGTCETPCSGDPSQMCGGYCANSIYWVNGTEHSLTSSTCHKETYLVQHAMGLSWSITLQPYEPPSAMPQLSGELPLLQVGITVSPDAASALQAAGAVYWTHALVPVQAMSMPPLHAAYLPPPAVLKGTDDSCAATAVDRQLRGRHCVLYASLFQVADGVYLEVLGKLAPSSAYPTTDWMRAVLRLVVVQSSAT